ncbi:MAG: DUF3343 domain-containing protein [Bacillota bacterium]
MARTVYITFPNIHSAMQAESLLSGGPWRVRLLPVPRIISASCGMAMRCPSEDAGAVSSFLEEESVPVEGQYELDGDVLLSCRPEGG